MKLFKLRLILSFVFINFIGLILYLTLCIIGFLLLEFPHFLIFSSFLLIGLIIFIFYFSKNFLKKLKTLLSKIEIKIFGKRLFLLDTYEETKIKNKDLFSKIESQLKKNKTYLQYYKDEKIKILKSVIICLFIIITLITINLSINHHIKNKINDIKLFLKTDFKFYLPQYYIINKNLRIELTDYSKYDKTLIFISNLVFQVKTNHFIIPENLTKEDTLAIKIYIQKYGITRKIYEKKLIGTTKFLPARILTIIQYPFMPDPYEIEGIQNLEVYRNSVITIKGEMTKEIKEIKTSRQVASEFKDSSFNIKIVPDRTSLLNIKFLAFDDDTYEIKDINIKVKPNLSPELKIEFPKEEVVITSFPWRLVALLKTIDDQGIKKILVQCTVENESPHLKNLSYKKKFSYETPQSKEIEYKLSYSSSDLELLPGDRATFYVRAVDVFGSHSKIESFSLYAPSFEWIDRMNENKLKQIYSILSNLSKGDIFNENIDSKNIEKEKAISDLSNLLKNLNEIDTLFQQNMNYEETKEIVDKMKDITKKLDEFLKNKDEFFLPIMDEKQDSIQLKFENPKEYLWQMEKLLDSLQKQREIIKKQSQIEEMKKLLTNLKEEKDKDKFDNKLSSYKNYIKSKKEIFDKNLMELLEKEAEKLDPKNEESFNKSFEIIEKISESISQNNKKQKENLKKQTEEILNFMIEETILNIMLAENLKKNIINFSFLPENSIINTRAIKASVINLKKIYREKLGFYFLIYKDYYKTINILEKLEKDITDIEDHLRERRYYNFSMSLPRIIIGFNKLYLLLKEFNHFLNSKEFENLTEQSQTISLGNIIKMQQMMTGGLKKMLSEKQGSPEYQKLKEELEKLQKAINESLGKLLKEGNLSGGKDIEEDMKDILKDIIEEKVSDKTIEKSKKLEEKLLKSKKGLTKKGLEDERKAESAKEYEIIPPEDIIFKRELKKTFSDITNKDIPFYYRIMIERYKREIEK